MSELTLTEAQNGDDVAVRVGDAIVITLPETPGSGHRWSAVALEEAYLKVERHEYEPSGKGVGGAGSSVWALRATHAGRTRIELKKSRSWEPPDAAVDRFTCSIEIKSQ